MLNIGILALQGAFIEHEAMLRSLGVATHQVRLPADLLPLDGLIIPGGESTTIGKLARTYGLIDPLRDFALSRPTWGTCAGLIFLAKDIGIESQPILGVMDIRVNRNAFGRQIDSFETDLSLRGIADEDHPFHAIFIRAPLVEAVGVGVEVLAELPQRGMVAVKQGHWLGTAFHPELTRDDRVHRHFCQMVADAKQA